VFLAEVLLTIRLKWPVPPHRQQMGLFILLYLVLSERGPQGALTLYTWAHTAFQPLPSSVLTSCCSFAERWSSHLQYHSFSAFDLVGQTFQK
jgi:hypothetical protein